MSRTRTELERENAQLWQKLEAIYDELHPLFPENVDEDDEAEADEE